MHLSPVEIHTERWFDMATNKETLDDHEARLGVVEVELGIRPRTKGRWSTLRGWAEKNPVLAVGVSAAMLGFVGWFAVPAFTYHLNHKNDSFNESVKNAVEANVKPVTDRLDKFDLRLTGIEGQLSVLVIQRAALEPTNPVNAKRAVEVLAAAKNNGLELDSTAIVESGQKFIAAAQKSTEAWSAALAFIGYRSFLNASTTFPLSGLETRADGTKYYYVPNGSDPQFSHYGRVPVTQAARLNTIGTNLNTDRMDGDVFLVADGGGMIIDHMDMKNIVLRNVRIVYHGGPLVMENVYFLNCTFEVSRSPNSQILSAKLVEPAPTSASMPNS